MDAIELEKQINKKFGKYKNHEIDKRFYLIRTLETDEIVIIDLASPGNGHHLLKDASQKEIEKISGHFNFPDDKQGENSFISGTLDKSDSESNSEEINPFIPDSNSSQDSNSEEENPFIP